MSTPITALQVRRTAQPKSFEKGRCDTNNSDDESGTITKTANEEDVGEVIDDSPPAAPSGSIKRAREDETVVVTESKKQKQ